MSSTPTVALAEAFVTLVSQANAIAQQLSAATAQQSSIVSTIASLTSQQSALQAEITALMAADQQFQIVPGPNGDLISEFPTGIIPNLIIASIAVPVQSTNGAPFSLDLSSFVTGTYTSLALQVVGGGSLPAGWAFNGTVLTYTPGAAGTASVQLVAFNGVSNVLSAAFTIQAIAAPVIASIPAFTNKAAPFSVDLSQYVSGISTALSLTSGGPILALPPGWSFAGTTLSYSGTGTGTASLQLIVTWTGGTVKSGVFAISSVSSVGSDTYAPTVPVGVRAVLAQTGINVSFVPTSDPLQPGQTRSGLAPYKIQRNIAGGAFADLVTINPASAGFAFTASGHDFGTPPAPGSVTQAGDKWTLQSNGFFWTTAKSGTGAPCPITGNFTATFRVVSFVDTDKFGKCGALAIASIDAVNGPGAPYVLADVRPPLGGVGVNMDYCATQGASPSATTPVPNSAVNLYVMFQRSGTDQGANVGNTWTVWASSDPNLLGTAASQVAQQSVALPATVYLSPLCAGGSASGNAVIDQWNVTQDPIITYNDKTATSTNAIYGYQVLSADVAANGSVYSEAATCSTSPAQGVDTSVTALLTYLAGLRTSGGKKILIGQHDSYWDSNPDDYAQAIATATGKSIAIRGITTGQEGANEGPTGSYDPVAAANDQFAKGGVVMDSWWPKNPFTGTYGGSAVSNAQFEQLLNPGNAAYTAWYSILDEQISYIKRMNGPVIFRPFLEMNGTWSWWGNQKTTDFAKLWQAMHAYFASKGVTNVAWMFAPNWGGGNDGTAYYPGDAYVDVVGVDIYSNTPGSSITSDSCYSQLSATNKPFIIAETGVGNATTQPAVNSGDNNALYQDVKSNAHNIVGIVWFCQGWGLQLQRNATTVMTDAAAITLTDLPGGLTGNTYNILPLGDSVTMGCGSSSALGYRQLLANSLTAAGKQFKYVGNLGIGCNQAMTPNPALMHDGYPGFTTNAILNGGTDNYGDVSTGIDSLMSSAKPDVVLLMIGTNDTGSSGSEAPTPALYDTLVRRIASDRPSARIIAAKIPPRTDSSINTIIQTFNSAIAGYLSSWQSAGINVTMVDMYSALNPSTDISSDGIHPNDSGYTKIANVWLAGIEAVI